MHIKYIFGNVYLYSKIEQNNSRKQKKVKHFQNIKINKKLKQIKKKTIYIIFLYIYVKLKI